MLGHSEDRPEVLRGGAEYLESFQRHGKPSAIVDRELRGYSLHRVRSSLTLEEREQLKDSLRPDGQVSTEWKYRPPL